MRRPITWTGIVFLIWASVAYTQEERVPLDKVPKPVMEAVKARFNDADVTGASKETEDGKLVYEVTIKLKGQNIDVTVTPQGETLVVEKEIATGDLPKAVTKVLEDKYPKATYKIVEEITKVEKNEEKLAFYEVLLVTAEENALEVEVTAEGRIVNEEEGTDEDDEE